jgi:hypothetical protein
LASTWTYYPPASESSTTRSSRRYRTGQFGLIPPQDSILYPATVLHQQSGYFSVVTSDSPFGEEPLSALPDLWRHTTTPEALANTPPFFQHLLSNPLSSDQCQIIASGIQNDHFVACSDGAYDPSTSKASHGGVYASDLLQETLACGPGPVDGHPNLVTS